MHRLSIESPIGPLEIVQDKAVIVRLHIGKLDRGSVNNTSLLEEAKMQLDAYFNHQRTTFDLPLAPAVTEFQKKMRAYMVAIPLGETRSYGDAAKFLATAARAVGQACGRNPIPIIVPCHRIIAATGQLGGFSGGDGPPTKHLLLKLEANSQ
jgi:methylated-DNA-[protein]-cysteine S-methyltransferase